MTFDQQEGWCRICGKVGCACGYCHGARFMRFNGQPIRCDACNPAPEAEEPPAIPSRAARRGRSYADRLES